MPPTKKSAQLALQTPTAAANGDRQEPMLASDGSIGFMCVICQVQNPSKKLIPSEPCTPELENDHDVAKNDKLRPTTACANCDAAVHERCCRRAIQNAVNRNSISEEEGEALDYLCKAELGLIQYVCNKQDCMREMMPNALAKVAASVAAQEKRKRDQEAYAQATQLQPLSKSVRTRLSRAQDQVNRARQITERLGSEVEADTRSCQKRTRLELTVDSASGNGNVNKKKKIKDPGTGRKPVSGSAASAGDGPDPSVMESTTVSKRKGRLQPGVVGGENVHPLQLESDQGPWICATASVDEAGFASCHMNSEDGIVDLGSQMTFACQGCGRHLHHLCSIQFGNEGEDGLGKEWCGGKGVCALDPGAAPEAWPSGAGNPESEAAPNPEQVAAGRPGSLSIEGLDLDVSKDGAALALVMQLVNTQKFIGDTVVATRREVAALAASVQQIQSQLDAGAAAGHGTGGRGARTRARGRNAQVHEGTDKRSLDDNCATAVWKLLKSLPGPPEKQVALSKPATKSLQRVATQFCQCFKFTVLISVYDFIIEQYQLNPESITCQTGTISKDQSGEISSRITRAFTVCVKDAETRWKKRRMKKKLADCQKVVKTEANMAQFLVNLLNDSAVAQCWGQIHIATVLKFCQDSGDTQLVSSEQLGLSHLLHFLGAGDVLIDGAISDLETYSVQ